MAEETQVPGSENMSALTRHSLLFENPKSICVCHHLGDSKSEPAEHAGIFAHGPCKVCPCEKFVWKGWTEEYKQFMRRGGFKIDDH